MLDSLPPAERTALAVSAVASVLLHAWALGIAPRFQHWHEPPPAPSALTVEIRPVEVPPMAPPVPDARAPKAEAIPTPKPRREPVAPRQTPTPVLQLDSPAAAPVATAPPPAPEAPAAPPPPTAEPRATPPLAAPSYEGAHLRNSPARYPPSAQRNGVEGTVQLRVQVLPSGAAGRVVLESSSGSAALDDAAVAAVKNWRFEPARRGAEAVEATVIVPIVFRLVRG